MRSLFFVALWALFMSPANAQQEKPNIAELGMRVEDPAMSECMEGKSVEC